MFEFPAKIVNKDGNFIVTFRDIPEALTEADTFEKARDMAVDALVTAMDFYFEDGRPVPKATRARKGETVVVLPASVSAKVLLLNAMLGSGVSAAELARRMHTSPQTVNRIVNLGHATKVDTIASALQALGQRLVIAAEPLPTA